MHAGMSLGRSAAQLKAAGNQTGRRVELTACRINVLTEVRHGYQEDSCFTPNSFTAQQPTACVCVCSTFTPAWLHAASHFLGLETEK